MTLVRNPWLTTKRCSRITVRGGGDRVRIIGISDKEPIDTVVNHVNSNGWTKVNHFHKAASNCKEIYNVKSIPHILLVDTNGKIVYEGHPG